MPIRPSIALAFVILSLAWGYGWVFLKLGSYDSAPFSFAGLRSVLGAVPLLLALPMTGRRMLPRRLPELFPLGLINTTALVGCSQWALVEGAATRTSILMYTMPFWTLLLAWPILNERIRGMQWLAIVVAAAGLVAAVQPWNFEGNLKSSLIAVTGSFMWAIGVIMIKRMQLKEPVDSLHLAGWQMAIGGAFLLGIAWIVGEPPIVWSQRFVIALGFTSFVSTALGWFLWVYLLRHMTAGAAGMTTLVIPVIAVVSSSFHLGESLVLGDIIGIALILSGLALLTFRDLGRASNG